MEPLRSIEGKPVPNWPKLVEPIQNLTFCGKQFQEFETTIRKEFKPGPSKTRGPAWDEDGQEVRKRLTIFAPSMTSISIWPRLGKAPFSNCHGKHPLDV